MSKSKRKKGGRPLKSGPRYASGRLVADRKPKPVAPNEAVLAERRRRLGDPKAAPGLCAKADDPLDLFLERGWIDAELFSAGRWYLALHARAGVSVPRVGVFDPNASAKGYDHSLGDAGAMRSLRAIWDRMAGLHGVAAALSEVALHGVFPRWAEFWFANPPSLDPIDLSRHPEGVGPGAVYDPDRTMPPLYRLNRAALLKGLRIVREAQLAGRDAPKRLHPFGEVAA